MAGKGALLPLGIVASAIVAVELAFLLLPPRLEAAGAAFYGVVLLAVAYVAFSAGLRSGLAAAGIASPYAFLFYWTHAEGILRTPFERTILAFAVLVVTFGFASILGVASDRARDANARALAAERRLVDEQSKRSSALAQANRSLRRTNESLEAFSYVVGHDLKEPVRALLGLHEAIVHDHARELPAEAASLVRLEGEALLRLAALTDGLLELSRVGELDRADLHPVVVADVLHSAACRARYADSLAAHGATLEVIVEARAQPALATEPAVAQILGNLVANAIRHNPNRSRVVRVTVRPGASDREVDVLVEDDGPGYSTPALARFSHPSPRTMRDGRFGLLIVRRAVEHLGGRVRLGRSADLGGALAQVTFPAASAAA